MSVTQDSGERFEVFLGEIRRLPESCDFGAVQDSTVRDRIVVGIRDDVTPHKLNCRGAIWHWNRRSTCARQVRPPACKSKRWHHRRMKFNRRREWKIITADSKRHNRGRSTTRWDEHGRRDRSRPRDNTNRKCMFYGGSHVCRMELCPAYGKTCRNCHKKNHFDVGCKRKQEGREIDDSEEALTLTEITGPLLSPAHAHENIRTYGMFHVRLRCYREFNSGVSRKWNLFTE